MQCFELRAYSTPDEHWVQGSASCEHIAIFKRTKMPTIGYIKEINVNHNSLVGTVYNKWLIKILRITATIWINVTFGG